MGLAAAAAAADSALDEEIEFEIPAYFRYYRSGRVERFAGTSTVAPSLDPTTGVDSTDALIDPSTGVSARLYLPPSTAAPPPLGEIKFPVLLYFHGGGFCIESAASPSYHRHLNNLAALTPLLAVSVNYRLAPEHRLPAAYDDAWAALRWVFSGVHPWVSQWGDLKRLFVAGDSAGANIAHHLTMRAAELPSAVKGVALVHPFFWGSAPVGSEPSDSNFRATMDRRWWFVHPTAVGPDDPCWNPTGEAAPSLAELGCTRLLVTVADNDFLKNRGRLYYEKLKESGWKGEAEFVETPALGHVFHLLDPDSEIAGKKLRLLADFFRRE
ncbi:putative carboxylesterase 2 [Platanthera guangdongensis]|uniref:Carboxylesterase 2 n=1 Tax=Platanthera guangdongensis TaxID=2320717 RepID=A0ABR2MUA4_9ASPA